MKRVAQWARARGSVRRALGAGLALLGMAAALGSQPAAAASYTVVDLGNLGADPAWGPAVPSGINASGQVVGVGHAPGGSPQAFLNDLTGMYKRNREEPGAVSLHVCAGSRRASNQAFGIVRAPALCVRSPGGAGASMAY